MSQENLTVGNRCPFDRPEPDGERHKSAGKIRAGTSNPQFILGDGLTLGDIHVCQKCGSLFWEFLV